MADMTPTPWPEGLPLDSFDHERLWPNGSDAAWAFDSGEWEVFKPGTGPGLMRRGPTFAANDPMGEADGRSEAILEAARAAADEALSHLLAEMAAEAPHAP